jgi:hypothetical protein
LKKKVFPTQEYVNYLEICRICKVDYDVLRTT